MKKNMLHKSISMALGVMMCIGLIAGPKLDVEAAHASVATVQGTVCKGTTADSLILYTASNGKYTIAIDGETNASACKVLTVGKTVTVTMCKKSDGSYHADVISVGNKTAGLSLDTVNKITCTGTVQNATTDDVLVLKASDGEKRFKLAVTTDFSGCSILVSGKTVTVVGAKGSDGNTYALSVNSGSTPAAATTTTSTTSTTTATTTTTSSMPANTIEVKGTPSSKSKDGELYLDTKDGTYYLVVDSDADTSSGIMFTSGNEVTAYIYRGSDANMHTCKVTGKRSSGATVGSSTTAFTGTVSSKSKEEMLYLETSGGTMEIKLDGSTTLSGAKGLVKGKKVTVNAATGSDSYWHAVSIQAINEK